VRGRLDGKNAKDGDNDDDEDQQQEQVPLLIVSVTVVSKQPDCRKPNKVFIFKCIIN
jgi:hypothetical protein